MAGYNHSPTRYSFVARQLQHSCSQLATCRRAGHCGAGQVISRRCLQQRGKNCPQCRDLYPGLSIPVNPMARGHEQSSVAGPALTALSHGCSHANLCESYCSFQPKRSSGSAAPMRQYENTKHLVNGVAIWCAQCTGYGLCWRHLEPIPHAREHDLVSTSSPTFECCLIWGMLRFCTRRCSLPARYW